MAWPSVNKVVYDGVFSTIKSLNVVFQYCCCNISTKVENFIMEQGLITITDGHTMSSDLGNVGACYTPSGYCYTMDGLIIWGVYEAVASGNFWVIDALQSAFSLSPVNATTLLGWQCPLASTCLLTEQVVALAPISNSSLGDLFVTTTRNSISNTGPQTKKDGLQTIIYM